MEGNFARHDRQISIRARAGRQHIPARDPARSPEIRYHIKMSHPDTPELGLGRLIAEEKAPPRRIATFLDDLPSPQQIAAVRSLGRSQLQSLFRLVDGFGELTLEHLVPAHVAPYTPVRHFGRNSLLLFTHFEKRFYRTERNEVAGANFQTVSPLTGPGYFVARRDPKRPEILIDYERLPAQAPRGWPPIRNNETGVSRLVYGFMIDRLRRVSNHVCIGSASRHGRALGAYFILCRESSDTARS
jgi:hypothetical protein